MFVSLPSLRLLNTRQRRESATYAPPHSPGRKDAWREDVLAVSETCQRFGISYAIERSRSGNGAHVWFFFSRPVVAATARRMGSYLITESMARRHQLSMASYDRLFPNQDTLPNGGFGNLIAPPLQYHARQEGNTVFLDDSLESFPDQWPFLASLVPIPAEKVEKIAMEATTRGQVIGLQIADTGEHDVEASPWLRPPSRKPKHVPVNEPVPHKVRGVLSQRLYVEKAGQPSALINQIKRLAAFQNPEFYKKQNLRLSTALTPQVISCAEDRGKHISLPRGCRVLADGTGLRQRAAAPERTIRHGQDRSRMSVESARLLIWGQAGAARRCPSARGLQPAKRLRSGSARPG